MGPCPKPSAMNLELLHILESLFPHPHPHLIPTPQTTSIIPVLPETPQTQPNQTPTPIIHHPILTMFHPVTPSPTRPRGSVRRPAGCRRLESVCDASHAQIHSSKQSA